MIAAASADLNVILGSLLSRASSRRAAQVRPGGRPAPVAGSARERSRSSPSPVVVMPAMMVMVVPTVVVMMPVRPVMMVPMSAVVVVPVRPVMMVPMPAMVMMVMPMLHRPDHVAGLGDRRLSRRGSCLRGTRETEPDRDGQDHLTERHERLLMVCDTAN